MKVNWYYYSQYMGKYKLCSSHHQPGGFHVILTHPKEIYLPNPHLGKYHSERSTLVTHQFREDLGDPLVMTSIAMEHVEQGHRHSGCSHM